MTPSEFESCFLSRHKDSQSCCHRLVVLLQGPQQDVLSLVNYLIRKTSLTKIVYRCEARNNRDGLGVDASVDANLNTPWQAVENRSLTKILGSEAEVVVYNGFYGVDPDAIGALSGAIVAGGVMFLLLPEMIPEQVANDYLKRYWPHSFPIESEQLFIKRLYDVFYRHPDVIKYRVDAAMLDSLKTKINKQIDLDCSINTKTFMSTDSALNGGQLKALEKIERVIAGHAKRPLIITADRGRGKSYLLGFAAAQCQQKQARRVLITASLKSSVDVAFATAHVFSETVLDLPNTSATKLAFKNGGSITFVAVDDLVESHHEGDILFVDEAASIPTFILEKLLCRYNRVVFSSTVHGYEGHGRGFAISFRKLLPKHVKQWSEITLSEPIRWGANDPLEEVTNVSLLLDADYKVDEAFAVDNKKVNFTCEMIGKRELATDDNLLQAVFGLLVAAHYQTSPSDLLILLDTPNTHLFIAYGDLLHEPNKSVRRNVVGVCLVCIEGGFTQALDVEILEGRRRVRGHLLPQSFAFHSGCRGASMLRCLRVMRIATAPSNLRNGIATALLGKAEQFCKDESLDYFATSFSATPDVCAFWSRNDFLLLRVGLTKDSSSGSYSIMMGKATTSQAKDLFAELRMKLGYSLKYQLITRYQSMLSETAFFLFSQTDPLLIAGSKGTFVADVDAFCQGHRSYESCAGAIFEWLWSVDRQLLQTACSLTSDVLVRRVLQGVSVSTACKELGMSGERSLNQALRDALLVVRQNMLSCHEAACTGDNP